jgi:murein DD-endopeptidase MepM/ murein hydrolase activator NlpD
MEQGTHIALAGSSVQAILSGVVRAIIVDRFPYGNAILVETRLQPEDDRRNILDPLPSPWADVEPDPALTCPASGDQQIEHERSSIYILYAHLLEAPTVAVDDAVDCGETIGKIGMSGNALNPHVHVETRLGPPSIHLESMAHYDSSATLLEMNAYCQWRVSGIFQHFDPMLLIRGLSSSTSP